MIKKLEDKLSYTQMLLKKARKKVDYLGWSELEARIHILETLELLLVSEIERLT